MPVYHIPTISLHDQLSQHFQRQYIAGRAERTAKSARQTAHTNMRGVKGARKPGALKTGSKALAQAVDLLWTENQELQRQLDEVYRHFQESNARHGR